MKRKVRFLSALLAVLVLCLSLSESAFAETAVAVQLMKTEGTVSVTNNRDREMTILEKMRLYNGYFVSTDEKSYAWINLDDTKLAKLDAVSRLELRKDGKQLQLLLHEGALFFNVTEPLEEDETLELCTATMVAGIRGTCGWIRKINSGETELCILEGSVQCTFTNPATGEQQTVLVSSGEIVLFRVDEEQKTCHIEVRKVKKEEIPGFVLKEIAGDGALQDKIFRMSGIDLRNLTEEEVQARLEEDQAGTAQRLEEIRDRTDRKRVIFGDPVWEDAVVNSSEPVTQITVKQTAESETKSGTTTEAGTESTTEPETVTETKIVFDANGGTGGPAELVGEKGAQILDEFPTDVPSREEGFTFIGWYPNKDGSGTKVEKYPKVFPEGITTYYAKWEYKAGNFGISGGNLGVDYRYENGVLIILTGTPVTVSGSTKTDTIAIQQGISANVTLSGVSIDLANISDSSGKFPAPVTIPDGTSAVITLSGSNSLTGGPLKAALEKGGVNGVLTIKGSGSLDAVSQHGAGIGASEGDSGNIVIESGTINAQGHSSGAGIGGGYNGDGINITIKGGTINATGGEYAAGIGGGWCPSGSKGNGTNITISGGVVTANGGEYGGAGIGGGMDGGQGNGISITGGIVRTNAGGNASCIGGGPDGNGDNGNLTGGIIFKGTSGQVYGTVTLSQSLEIGTGESLHIPSGSRLIIPDGISLTNNGTITYDAATQGEAVSGNLVNNGQIIPSAAGNNILFLGEKALAQVKAKVLASETMEDETMETETVEDETTETETVEDETTETETVEDETIQVETAEEEAIESETAEDETVGSETTENEIIESETMEDEIIESETAEAKTTKVETTEAEAVKAETTADESREDETDEEEEGQ